MPTTFLVVLVIWLCMLFGGFGFFATPQRNGPLGPRALCGCGFQLDLSDTGDEPAIHRADQDLQRTAALRPLPARASSYKDEPEHVSNEAAHGEVHIQQRVDKTE